MAEGSIMELGVVIRAIDYFTGPLRSMVSSVTAAEGKFKSITNTMKMMGKSTAEIDAINASLNRMKDAQAFSGVASDLEKIGMAKGDIAAMEGSYMRMAQYQRDMADAQGKYAAGKDLAMSGVGSLAVGGLGAFGIVEMLKQAGDFQDQLVTIQDSTGATNQQMANFGDVIKQTSAQVSKFNDLQVAGMAKQLASGGFGNSIAQVQSVLPTVAKFAEVQSYEGKQTDPTESVKQAIEMAHTYGHYDPKSFMNFLNNFNKYSLMQPGDSTQLEQTMKYLAPTANSMHMSEASSMALAAVDNTLGLSGSHGGTNSADMIMRLIPGLIGGKPTPIKNKKGQITGYKTPKAWSAMEQLGFIDKNGKSKFFDSKGNLTDLNGMLSTMIGDSKKFNPMQLTGLYKDIFGIQGGRAASILSNPRSMEQLQKMQGQLGHTKSVDQQTADYQKTASGQLNLMKSNSMSIMLSVAQQLAVALNPALIKMNALLTSTLKFSIAHPMFAKIIGDIALFAVGGKLAEGAIKLLAGNFKMASAAIKIFQLKKASGELSAFGKVVNAFKMTKATGEMTRFGKIVTSSWSGLNKFGGAINGVVSKGLTSLGKNLKTLGKGFETGIKSVGKFSTALGKITGKAAISALRGIGKALGTMGKGVLGAIKVLGKFGVKILEVGAKMAIWAVQIAADWLIAMGPVGWIILGVTAIIAAAVIAWKTNFLGFRDGLKAVWNAIKSGAVTAWNAIVSAVKKAIGWFKSLPGEMLSIGKNIIDGIGNGIKNAAGGLLNTVKSIGTSISGAFKSIMKINSPSKVFMAHGASIVEGLTMGIDRNAHLANKSTVNLANGVTGSFNTKFNNDQTPISMPNRNNTGGGYTDNSQIVFQAGSIVLNPQPGQDAKSLARDTMNEIGKLLRKQGYRSGKNPVNAW
jgi:hypothetical protein